ncbi:hypothetical protein E2C01_092734 [Portunus trituberculatus]|uniref:Uncharacterized protein n=1 Tax=Portunus trituberculatus TaxID=210409 RepID=A0A5B7JRD6_PORTR|nr:hypothetical protein [Portunus trituberculatus]
MTRTKRNSARMTRRKGFLAKSKGALSVRNFSISLSKTVHKFSFTHFLHKVKTSLCTNS